MTSVAIMQPTYLPWMGYFALMDRVDRFVFLDSVQFERRSWQQRNRIKSANGVQMLTVPVLKKGRRDERVLQVEINPDENFARVHRRGIEIAYRRAPFFEKYASAFFTILESEHRLLADLNIAIIAWVAREVGISTPCSRSSTMQADGKREAVLVAICQELGATNYVSPPGAHSYLDKTTAFPDAGIGLTWHQYEHPSYPQLYEPFLPYMAAIDLLFNVGPDSLAYIRRGLQGPS